MLRQQADSAAGEIAAGLDDIFEFPFSQRHDEELLLHDFEFSDLSIVQGGLNDEGAPRSNRT